MRKIITTIAFLAHLLCSATAHAVVTFDWATVENPRNAPDDTGLGAVSNVYRISKHEVTNAQYAEFLNAVDPTGGNSLALYNSFMSSNANGGINFNSGAANGSKYQPKSGRDNNPVVYVSFFDAMRFTNWLANGQGTGSTESGAYTIGNGLKETRNPSATYFIPSEDEWYKAAYHKNDGVTGNYWVYPTSTDAVPYSDQPPGSDAPTQSNTANFFKLDFSAIGYDDGYAVTGSMSFSNTQNYLTDVGAYTASLSPYGTFDQGGNVYEWNEAVITIDGVTYRSLRGGGCFDTFNFLTPAGRLDRSPSDELNSMGFRVASFPEPTVVCDFSGDGACDVTDVDLMQALGPISGSGVPATGNEQFDLNRDGTIDLTDRDQWLAIAATENGFASPYKLGDANIDGIVDGQDFIAWNASKFTSDLRWSHGVLLLVASRKR